jgi:hypothetical protein
MGDELEKIALLGRLWNAGPNWGRALGALGGAGAGAGIGYLRAPDEESRLPSALGHAAVGAGLGLAGGQFMTRAGLQQASRFGQRQLHGFTGKLPGHGFRESLSVKGPERIEALKKMKWTLPEQVPEHVQGKVTEKAVRGAIQAAETGAQQEQGRIMGPILRSSLAQRIRESRPYAWHTRQRLQSALAQQQLAEAGLTSIPGSLKAYIAGSPETGLGRAGLLAANLRAPGLVTGAGLPLLFAAPSAVEAVQERDVRPLIRGVGEGAATVAMGGLPMIPMMATGDLVSRGLGTALRTPVREVQS